MITTKVDLADSYHTDWYQYELFVRTFPDGIEWTAENVERADQAGIELPWLAENAKCLNIIDKCRSIKSKRSAKQIAAWNKYHKAVNQERDSFKTKMLVVWDEHDAKVDAMPPCDDAKLIELEAELDAKVKPVSKQNDDNLEKLSRKLDADLASATDWYRAEIKKEIIAACRPLSS